MFNYVPRVLVGKASGAVSTAQTPGQTLNLATVVAGDLYVVSEDMIVLDAAGAAAADTIKIARGSSNGRVILSSPIVRSKIRKHGFTFQAYAAPVAQVSNFADLGLAAGKEYRLTVVIKDDLRLIANRQNRISTSLSTRSTSFVAADDIARLVANFNKQRGVLGLITASANGSTGITLTSKPVATESINDYEFVSFEATFVEVTAGVNPVAILPSSETKAQGGQGLAVQIRQAERQAYGALGVTDLRNFDRPVPAYAAVDGVGYDVWHIMSRVESQGALQQVMSSPVITTIAVATGSAQKQAIEPILEAFVSALATGAPHGE